MTVLDYEIIEDTDFQFEEPCQFDANRADWIVVMRCCKTTIYICNADLQKHYDYIESCDDTSPSWCKFCSHVFPPKDLDYFEDVRPIR